jgi:hypothetical protein
MNWFAVNHPINVTLSNGTNVQIKSDAEFQNAPNVFTWKTKRRQEDTADEVAILSGTKFKVETFIAEQIPYKRLCKLVDRIYK